MTLLRRLLEGPSAFTALEACNLGLGFLMQALIMRALGSEAYGHYALAVSFGVVAVTLTDFGFNFAGVVRSVTTSDPADARRLFWTVQCVKAGVGVAGMLVALLWALTSALTQAKLIAVAWSLGFASAWCFPSWFLLGRQRLLTVAGTGVLARLLLLNAAMLLVKGPDDISLALACTGGAPVLAGMLCLRDPVLRAVLRPYRVTAAEWQAAFATGASTLWLSAQPVLSGAVTQSLLYSVTSGSTLGIYAAADRVRGGVQGLFVAFSTAVFPGRVAARVGVGADLGPASRQAWRSLALQVGAAAAVSVPILVSAPSIVRVVSGAEFSASAPVLEWLALALVSSTALSALGIQILLPAKRGRQFSIAAAAALALQCAGIALLAPRFGALGAAWALLLSETLISLLLFFALRPKGGGIAR